MMCTTIGSKHVKIRKGHKCFGCETLFQAGSMMWAEKTRGDGRIYTLHLCDRCKDAAKRIGWNRGESYQEGELREHWATPSCVPELDAEIF